MKTIKCVICHKPLTGKALRFCSNPCRYRDGYLKHRTKRVANQARYYAEHKEEELVRRKEYYQKHRKKIIKVARLWAKAHPDKIREYNKNRYILVKQLIKEHREKTGHHV